MPRTAHLVLAGFVGLAGLAPPSSAGTLSAVLQEDRNPGQLLEYDGGPGEVNRLSVVLSPDSALVTDPAGITPGPGCSAVRGQPSQATCAREGYYRYLEVELGDGDDEIVALAPGLTATIEGGSGNDVLRGIPTTRRTRSRTRCSPRAHRRARRSTSTASARTSGRSSPSPRTARSKS